MSEDAGADAERGYQPGDSAKVALVYAEAGLREALDETLRPYLEVLGIPGKSIDDIVRGSAARLAGFHGVARLPRANTAD